MAPYAPTNQSRPVWAASLLTVIAVALALGALVLRAVDGWESRRALGSPALGWGFTHTATSADHGDENAVQAARRLIGAVRVPQNQHIMGWGADNPEPSPGRYNFASLDDRMALIRDTGGLPVITLCCAPDWMKGGRPGHTDWNTIEKAPVPAHYQDFADLAATVARRYPAVRHFIVWNEFKGFFDEKRKRWDVEAYTRLYNLVYAALKEVNPNIMVGGPYLVMESYSNENSNHRSALAGPWGAVDQRALDAFDYWLRHKRGADFVVVDGSSTTKDRGLVTDEFSAARMFSDVSRWIKARTNAFLWWAEWYVEPEGSRWTEKHRIAVHAVSMMELARGGAAAALYWNPDSGASSCPGCLWTSTQLGHGRGGRPMPMLGLLHDFVRWFPPGTKLVEVPVSSPTVRVLAQERRGVAVNSTDALETASVDGRRMELAPYEVRWFDR